MKKLFAIITTLLLVVPFTVYAATPKVTSLNVNVETTTIKFDGEIEDGSLAYTCRLFTEDKEVDIYSGQVNNNKFNGEFVVTNAGEYKVSCTDYEGGTPVEKTAVVEVSTATEEVPSVNAKTFDAITLSFIILAICGLGAVFSATYLIKRKQK